MAVERIRGHRLHLLRRRLLTDNPLCVMCQAAGRVSLATELDHIVALVNGGGNEDENLQGLCRTCHADKTVIDMGRKPRVAIGLDGWPVDTNK